MESNDNRKTVAIDDNGKVVTEEEIESIEHVPLYRKRRVIVPLFIVVLAAVAGVWYWYVSIRDFVSTDDAYVDGTRISISSKILGRLAAVTADEGDTVARGQLLVRLEDNDLLAQKEQALASLDLARQSVSLADVNLARAADDYDRADQQYKSGVVTKEQYDHARHALAAAKAEQGIARSRVGASEAQVKVIQAQLDNTSIVSPVDGKVAKRWLEPGDIAQAGQPVLAVYDRKDTWVTANLEETGLQAIRLGQNAEITVDGYPGRRFSGTVIEIGSSTAAQFSLIPPNNASGNFTKVTQRIPVKISIREERAGDTPPALLLPGMSAEIRIRIH